MSEDIKPVEDYNDNPGKSGKRQRSTIGFPYTDYDSSATIAVAIHTYVGHGECSQGQLAAWTNQSVKSSGFRVQLSGAKLFGLIESGVDAGNLKLTELGRRIVDPNKARTAKAEAFLNVPLFKELYEKYKDGITPPNHALEREILLLGVAEKQIAKARQVFESSAQQTGFRDVDAKRLVMPAMIVKQGDNQEKLGNEDRDNSEGSLDLDPLIMALLRKIPKENWSAESRLRWFRTFAMNVSQVYDDDTNPVELKINLEAHVAKEQHNSIDDI